jgi:serine/threonine-protein kinase
MAACPKCQRPIEGRPNFCPACGASLTFGSRNDNDPLIGRTIANDYKVEMLVGEGAMGKVYRAQHLQLKKQVALKVLRSSLVSDATVVKRFEREAQAASRLNHPNCISIFGFGQEDNGELLWMAMEFIQGRDLGTIIAEDAPLPTARIVNIISQVCDALDEAHSANVIHRDLKPANIVCYNHRRTQDFVKVLDFGIAKITDPGSDYQPLTRDGIVCGTPAYMSPEQVQGFQLDPRSDLFSLGIILYQTITGMLPFHAESAVEVATKIVIEEPRSPSKVRPEWSYPPELEAIVTRLLRKKKEERYAHAIDVKKALEACMETLKARQDVSLEMSPDEVAGLLAQQDAPMEGAATLQLSTDMIARAMAAEGLMGLPTPRASAPPQRANLATAPTAPGPIMSASALADAERALAPTTPPVVAPGPGQSPSRPMPATSTATATGATAVRREPSAIMAGPTTAFREPDSSRQRTMMIGAGVVIAALVGAAVALL